MFATGKAASAMVEEKGLKQESDLGALEALCRQAIEANPKAVAEFRAGKARFDQFSEGPSHEALAREGQSCPYRRSPCPPAPATSV